MSGKFVGAVAFLLMLVILISPSPIPAQNPVKSLTLVYSNNINGEIEPCPT